MATKKKAKSGTSTKSATKQAKKSARRAGKAPDPRQVRTAVVNSVLRAARDIIQNVIVQAKQGNYQPAKFLFEFAGIAEPLPDTDEAAAARQKSLAEILLQAVGHPAAEEADQGGKQPAAD